MRQTGMCPICKERKKRIRRAYCGDCERDYNIKRKESQSLRDKKLKKREFVEVE